MKNTKRFIAYLLSLALLFAAAQAAEVCRQSSFAGMDGVTEQIHRVLGGNTTDITKIKLFVTEYDGTTYIQSNYLSRDPDDHTKYSNNPTKIRTDQVKDLRSALQNVIFWGQEDADQPNAGEMLRTALGTVRVIVDSEAMDNHGRISVDLSGAKNITLGTISGLVDTGRIELIDLSDPPPALAEVIDGCCLLGRPPGHANSIISKYSKRPIGKDSFGLLSLVSDRATQTRIAGSAVLSAGQGRAGYDAKDTWENRLQRALVASKGRALVVISHIEKTDVVVTDPSGKREFRIPLAKLRELANANDVELVLFGCDTASFIHANSSGMGVLGRYNTVTAAERINRALESATSLSDFLRGVASEDIKLVVYDEDGGPASGYGGASGFARSADHGFFVRVFRLLFLRGGSAHG